MAERPYGAAGVLAVRAMVDDEPDAALLLLASKQQRVL